MRLTSCCFEKVPNIRSSHSCSMAVSMHCGEHPRQPAEELPNLAAAAALAVGDVAARGSTVADAVGQAAAQAAALRLLAALLRIGGAAMPPALRATADVAALHSATTAEAAVEVCHCKPKHESAV